MRQIEITRTGDASIADQLSEMRAWLHDAGIEPLALEPLHILGAQVRFRARFATAAEAERFRQQFDETGALTPG
jgi:hypothetical protein